MKIKIFTDSNSGITIDEAKQLGIELIPMPFLINDEEYFEELTLSQEKFYEKLKTGASVSTSQPNIFSVCEKWTECLTEYDEIVYIPMSSALSNTCETAINQSQNFNGKVFVVDNKRISITQKQSVYDAIKMVNEGKSGKEIKEWLESTALDSSIYIMVTTLKYLKKGGRITPAAAAIGSLLNIKPVLQIQGGKLDKFCQVIAVNQGKKKMIEQICKDIETRFSSLLEQGKLGVSMAYTNCLEKCLEFKKEAETALSKYNLTIDFVDPLSLSVSSHIGDGSLAIGCFIKY